MCTYLRMLACTYVHQMPRSTLGTSRFSSAHLGAMVHATHASAGQATVLLHTGAEHPEPPEKKNRPLTVPSFVKHLVENPDAVQGPTVPHFQRLSAFTEP